MTSTSFSIADLRLFLREEAGVEAAGLLDGDILDTEFDDLGYDSLAMLETGSRIDRELGITLPDATIVESRTPRVLIHNVNAALAAVSASR